MEPISWATLIFAGKVLGSIAGAVAFATGVAKVITWIKTKFTSIDSNVVELKKSMDSHITGLRNDIRDQTTTIASALNEQRQDFRTFYAPTLLLMQNQQAQFQGQFPLPVRAKKPLKGKAKK